jgi:hypothetical protein
MSLVASDDRTGVPRVLVSRHVLGAVGREDAVCRACIAGRSGGYAYLCAEPEGDTYVVETSARRHALLEGVNGHTNHYLDPELASIGEEPSPGSLARNERICSLLAERVPQSPEEAMELLADHGSGGVGPCVHPDPSAGDEGDAIMFAMVCDVEARQMWVSPGQPCEAPFIEVELTEHPGQS